jgi:NAD(P)-dependent dehydrogenase (short-subunit alcohol dehydrogenase family)
MNIVYVLAIFTGVLALLLLLKLIMWLFVYKVNPYNLDLKGKHVLVTGGTAGIGLGTVVALVEKGALVIFTGRSEKAVKDTVISQLEQALTARIEQTSGKGDQYSSMENESFKANLKSLKNGRFDEQGNFVSDSINFRKTDFSDLTDVRRLAEWVVKSNIKLASLINNAGGYFPDYKQTVQKLEWTQGVNHFSHHYLTELLLPNIEDEGRIINLSSAAHRQMHNRKGRIEDWRNFTGRPKEGYKGWEQYCVSKLSNTLFTEAAQPVINRKGLRIKVVSLHPGVVRSNFFEAFGMNCVQVLLWPFKWVFMKSLYQGIQTTLYCVHAPFDQLKGSGYYDNCGEGSKNSCVTRDNADEFLRLSTAKLESTLNVKFVNLI